MKSKFQAANPPLKPLLVYDGDCNFCKYWVGRWRKGTGDAVEYLPLQDPQLAVRFPEIPHKEFETAIHFIETSGAIFFGAEAAFRVRAQNPKHHLLLNLYTRFRIFSFVAEGIYHLVSRHRSFFSWIWGTHP